MKTAKKLLKQKVYITRDGVEDVHDSLTTVSDTMIEFAQMHVIEALKHAAEKIKSDALEEYGTEVSDCWSTDSILNAYPLENIK